MPEASRRRRLGSGLPAGLRHAEDCRERVRREQDPSVGAPRAAKEQRRTGQRAHAAVQIDPLQPAVGAKPDRAAVGRPERAQRALGARERPRLETRRAAGARARLPGRVGGVKCEHAPVGREHRRADGQDARRVRYLEADGARRAWARAAPTRRRSQWLRARRAPRSSRPGPRPRPPCTGRSPGRPAREPPSCDPLELRPTSRALCQRSSGSFARHLRDDVIERGRRRAAARVEIAGGSRSRIAAIRLAALLPSNARRPGRHLVEHRAEREDVAARVGLPAPRAARAPCTGTCRESCRCSVSGRASVWSDDSTATALDASPDFRPGRSRAAWRRRAVSITLPGFRSRWTMPCAVRLVERVGDLGGEFEAPVPAAAGLSSSVSASDSPSRYSMTRNAPSRRRPRLGASPTS